MNRVGKRADRARPGTPDVEADFIVMGGDGHSRLRQAVLGGTSRTVLEKMSTPVVMAH